MATMNISLPDEMKAWVEKQTNSGRYSSSSDVVRDLVRRGIEREEAIASMNRAIDQGLASGIVEDYDPAERRRALHARFTAGAERSR